MKKEDLTFCSGDYIMKSNEIWKERKEMEQYVCTPLKVGGQYEVTVPGSKSMTNRALLLGALAKGRTVLKGVLFSEDSRVFMQALQEIGFALEIDEEEKRVSLEGCGGRTSFPKVTDSKKERKVYVGSAGTAARFLTAMLALSGERFYVESSEQMKGRPMEPLLRALEELGAKFVFKEKPYAFPFQICGYEERHPVRVNLNIDASSQFLSALLLSGVMCPEGVTVHLTGTRDARAYVGISMQMMKEFGCEAEQLDENTYRVLPGQAYTGREYQVEPDVSAACYFYGIAAVTGNRMKVRHVHCTTTQGDIRFLDVLKEMGCQVTEEGDGIVVAGPEGGHLRGVSVNMSDFSDQTMTLAAVAPFAEGDTVIEGIRHIRRQESDRIRGIVTELRRIGIDCEEREDGITIHPGTVRPAIIQTYEDHRMAMAFSIVGCKVEGIRIENPSCCKKTFETYFELLTNLDLTTKIK